MALEKESIRKDSFSKEQIQYTREGTGGTPSTHLDLQAHLVLIN
jgi:hypothetical protein